MTRDVSWLREDARVALWGPSGIPSGTERSTLWKRITKDFHVRCVDGNVFEAYRKDPRFFAEGSAHRDSHRGHWWYRINNGVEIGPFVKLRDLKSYVDFQDCQKELAND